ncbi:MAG: LytR/AlgR family response regulator transcription factor [Desulfitobacterium sp.]
MLIIAICDDLELDRNYLVNLIQNYCNPLFYDIRIKTFISGEDLAAYYEDEKMGFDVVFLDIYMGGDNGIRTAEKIRKFDSQCKIIFTTTSTDHALDSFKVFPFNYLTKPITKEVFNVIFEKAILNIDKEKQKILTVKTEHHIKNILYKDITFIESVSRQILIHTTEGTVVSYLKLDEVEINLNDKRFLRCHKSFLVNMDYITSVEDYSFILINNTEVPIKQRSFASIKKKLLHLYRG